jgi:plastocyanin
MSILVAAVALTVVPAATPRTTSTTVTVTMKEFKFVLSKTSVPHGTVTFKLVNKGSLQHDFKILTKKSALINAGKTGTLKVTLPKGLLSYKCTVAGHAAYGMKGKLKVT